MKIVTRYLFLESVKTSVGVFIVLITMMLGNAVIQFMNEVADGELSLQYMWPLLWLSSANFVVVYLVISAYIGIIVTYGRFYKDSEMSALVACGVNPWAMLKPCLMIAVPVVIFSALLNLWFVPKLNESYRVLSAQSDQIDVGDLIKSGDFNTLDGLVFYNKKRTKQDGVQQMDDVFVYQTTSEGEKTIQLADSADLTTVDGRYHLNLYSGKLFKQFADDSFAHIEYKQASSPIVIESALATESVPLNSVPTKELLKSKDINYITEFQWRISWTIVGLFLCVLAFPLSHTYPRKGAYSKLVYGVLIYFLYSNLLFSAKSLLEEGKIHPVIGMWWGHLPVILITLWLFAVRYNWFKRMFHYLTGSSRVRT